MTQLEEFTTPVDAVVSRMRALAAALPAQDGVAVFNRVYLAVTEAVDHHVDAGCFPDPRAAITLDVRFAERYLAAVDAVAADRRPPPAGSRCSSSAAIPAYGRRSSRSRASTRTSGTTSRSPSWTPAARSTANRSSWRTSSTAWAISS
ncbi:hypothetical protein GCM10020295_69250 [Streptomyces cinereospinus]